MVRIEDLMQHFRHSCNERALTTALVVTLLCVWSCAPVANRDITDESAASAGSTSAAAVTFASVSNSVGEYAGTLSIPVSISQARSIDTVATYQVTGSAINGNDHDLADGTVTIPAGSTSANIQISIVDDSDDESFETVSIEILNSATASPGDISTHTLTIRDNDPTVDAIDGGHYSFCALRDQKVYCWGEGRFGKMGDGFSSAREIPTLATNAGTSVSHLGMGQEGNCIVTGGRAYCWGRNENGQLGIGTVTMFENTPQTPTGLTSGVTAISYGNAFVCAIVSGGVKCWGYNSRGQVGDGTTTDRSTPVDVTGLGAGSGVTAIDNGIALHVCAITSTGGLKCWGNNAQGTLGDGTTTNRNTPTDVSGLGSGVTAVDVGSTATCAIVNNGLKCWGQNAYGQIGDGTTTQRLVPTDVPDFDSGVTAVSTEENVTCAIKSGALYCWGDNQYGQIGDGTTTNRSSPTAVSGLSAGVTRVHVTRRVVCALHHGEVKCWGMTVSGTGGTGNSQKHRSPVRVFSEYTSMDSITVGYKSTYFVNSGRLYAQGYDPSTTLGNGSTQHSSTPIQITSNLSAGGITKVENGRANICVLDGAAMKCFGDNWNGSTGVQASGVVQTPGDIGLLGIDMSNISVGRNVTCGIQNGSLLCWGNNEFGQLGTGNTTNRTTPTTVTGLGSNVTDVSAGRNFTCAVHSGAAKCTGDNTYGQLGNGTTTDSTSMVSVDTLTTGVTQISAGLSNACAVKSGEVWCWGSGSYGANGDGTTADRSSPVQVISSGATAVNVGYNFACALVSGQVQCWGRNTEGQVGVGSTANQFTSPQTISLFDGTTLQVTKLGHTNRSTMCAIVNNGERTYCWGLNGRNQIDTTQGEFPTLEPTPTGEW